MPRISLSVPSSFPFQCIIPVRITDLNYGGHVGNDALFSLIHEARIRFLRQAGFESEINPEGFGFIMADAAVQFKKEIFYGDELLVSVCISEMEKYGFDLFYKLDIKRESEEITAALAKTGMVCFDYTQRKIIKLPDQLVKVFNAYLSPVHTKS
ncbi:MAG: thioesterase family protein [Chitinophagaceae bacterium]|nr:thioesterase family protein [Chitinophagaceae bacterium]